VVLKFEALGLTLAPLFVQLGAPVEKLRIARRAGQVAISLKKLRFGEGVGRREWRERGGEYGMHVVHGKSSGRKKSRVGRAGCE